MTGSTAAVSIAARYVRPPLPLAGERAVRAAPVLSERRPPLTTLNAAKLISSIGQLGSVELGGVVPSPLVGEGQGGGAATMPRIKVSPVQRGRAKALRQTMTPAETLLWRHIKAHRINGLGFRRQMPFRNYVVDFACLSAKLIVELDGASHDDLAAQGADAHRDAFFASQGFVVMRFTNEQVKTNLEGVVEAIRQVASERLRVSPPSLTLPHKGGGNDELK